MASQVETVVHNMHNWLQKNWLTMELRGEYAEVQVNSFEPFDGLIYKRSRQPRLVGRYALIGIAWGEGEDPTASLPFTFISNKGGDIPDNPEEESVTFGLHLADWKLHMILLKMKQFAYYERPEFVVPQVGAQPLVELESSDDWYR